MNVKNVMLQLHQKPIAYYPVYRDLTGSTTAAILLSQLLYWYSACGGRKFYKSDSEIMEETRLTEKELRGAKNALKGNSFMNITLEGLPRRTFYDFDLSDLFAQLGEASAAQKAAQGTPKGRDSRRQKGGAITENTHKSTTKNTQRDIAANAAPEKIITPKIQNEKRKKVAPKKEKAPGLPFLMWEVWAERHKRLHREKPTQDAKFFKHLKDLAEKLAARIEAQGAEVSDAAICNNFGLFLDMLIQKGDAWYHTNFTPDIFNGKFLNIIQLLKQQHNEDQQLANKYARVIASFAE